MDLPDASRPAGRIAVAGFRLGWNLKRRGIVGTLGRIAGLAGSKVFRQAQDPPSVRRAPAATGTDSLSVRPMPAVADEALGLQPGELVEVRSEEEIRRTLDATGRCKGLFFMPEMKKYCGRKLRVHKRVERMLLEGTNEVRRVKDTVSLAGAMCEGVGLRCDRSCFFFWREIWLRRAASPSGDASA